MARRTFTSIGITDLERAAERGDRVAFEVARAAVVRQVEHAEQSEQHAERASLAGDLGAPMLVQAITGTPDEMRRAIALIRTHVEHHGSRAVAELERFAASYPGPRQLATNLARAAAALADADPAKIARVQRDHWTRDLERVIGTRRTAAAIQPRRRRG